MSEDDEKPRKYPEKPRMDVVTRGVDLHPVVFDRVKALGPYLANDPDLLELLGGRRTVPTAQILRILVADGLRYREAKYGIAEDPGESTPPDPSAGE